MGTKGVRKAGEEEGEKKWKHWDETEWEEFADRLFDDLYNLVIHYCAESDYPIQCLLAHTKMDLYKIVDYHYFFVSVTDELRADPLEIVRDMPRDLYEKLNEALLMELTEDLDGLVEQVKVECEEDCGGTSDRECLEKCYERNGLPEELW